MCDSTKPAQQKFIQTLISQDLQKLQKNFFGEENAKLQTSG